MTTLKELASFQHLKMLQHQRVAYVAIYVTGVKNLDTESTFILTDQDVECGNCVGDDDECPICNGSGVEWLELDDSSRVSRDPSILLKTFDTQTN